VLVLHGNVRDYYVDAEAAHANLLSLLGHLASAALGGSGRRVEVRTYDWVRGHDWLMGGEGELGGGENPSTIDDLEQDFEVLRGWLSGQEATGGPGPAAHVAVIEYADLLLPYQASYEDRQRHALIRLQQLMASVVPPHRLVLIALEDAWLSPHLYTSAPYVAVLRVPLPGKPERAAFLAHQLRRPERTWPTASEVSETIAEGTDGLSLRELDEVLELMREVGASSDDQFHEVVREWQTGARQSPWSQLSIAKVAEAREWLTGKVPGAGRGVQGQDDAVERVARALVIARAGLSSLASGRRGKPRITLLFAGPTGVGKTELAKRLAAFVFGDENRIVRFDMSEYQDDFTISRLLGAPPGYVGHEQGGLLARAIEEKPFSVVLFDEIEKAHPKILDIFLQVLDDGRITDARGQTVFFSEAAVIFTSNIGARKEPANWVPHDGRPPTERQVLESILSDVTVPVAVRYRRARAHFVEAVQRYFADEIGRPELLNRLRSGIVAFNPIEDTATKARIATGHIVEMESRLRGLIGGDHLDVSVEREIATAVLGRFFICPACGRTVVLPNEARSPQGTAVAEGPGSTPAWWVCAGCGTKTAAEDVPVRAAGRFGGRGVADDLAELVQFEISRALLARGAATSTATRLVVRMGPAAVDGCRCVEVVWE
jgi:energy-coupling factor transporter ATP-binding protein EcfA2